MNSLCSYTSKEQQVYSKEARAAAFGSAQQARESAYLPAAEESATSAKCCSAMNI
jgi:hypothetical protein